MTYEGAGLILLSPDLKILIVQDARTGKWGFPKGHRELQDNSDLETACRELLEETGIRPDSYTVHEPSFRITRGSSSYLFRYASAVQEEGRIQNAREISQIAWIPFQALINPPAEFDGNKYLRTWIDDMQKGASKKTVHVFNSLVQQRILDLCQTFTASYLHTPVHSSPI